MLLRSSLMKRYWKFLMYWFVPFYNRSYKHLTWQGYMPWGHPQTKCHCHSIEINGAKLYYIHIIVWLLPGLHGWVSIKDRLFQQPGLSSFYCSMSESYYHGKALPHNQGPSGIILWGKSSVTLLWQLPPIQMYIFLPQLGVCFHG